MLVHIHSFSFIRWKFSVPRRYVKYTFLTGSLANWTAKYSNLISGHRSLILTSDTLARIDLWSQSGYSESLRHFPTLPMTIDCLFLPAERPLASEKTTTWFTPTPPFFPLHPFFRTPAYVSFIRHVCGFRGLSERLLFFHVGHGWMLPLSLFSVFCCSLLLLYPFFYRFKLN